jgi:hypothetical protein
VIKEAAIIPIQFFSLLAMISACSGTNKHVANNEKKIIYQMAFDGTNEEIENRIKYYFKNKNCSEKREFFKEKLSAKFDGINSYTYDVEDSAFGINMVTTSIVFYIVDNDNCRIKAQRQGL